MADSTYIKDMRRLSRKLEFGGSIYSSQTPARGQGCPARLTLAQRRAVDRVSTEHVGWRPLRGETLGYFNG
jgi:hypothetical protein